MKYIEKQTSPQAFELWKENKKNRQKDLAKIEVKLMVVCYLNLLTY